MGDLRKEIKAMLDSGAISQSTIARGINKSPTVISMWIAGCYDGDNANLEEHIGAWLRVREEKRRASRTDIPFVFTSVAKKIYEVARFCRDHQEMGVVVGDAGVGKTVALRQLIKKYPNDILVEVDPSYSARHMMKVLCGKIKVDVRGGTPLMFDDVVERLLDTGNLLIVDEAENLPYKALEMLRRIHDKAGIGILLCGMPRLKFNLIGKRGEFTQLHSRVGICCTLDNLTEADTEGIVEAVLPKGAKLAGTFHECSGSNARALSKLIKQAVRVAGINNREIDEELIDKCRKLLIV